MPPFPLSLPLSLPPSLPLISVSFVPSQLSASVAKDLFLLFDGRSGDMIAPNNELILAFSMVSAAGLPSQHLALPVPCTVC